MLELIAPEDVVVTLSHSGYAKRQPVSSYRAQKRGGRGRNAAATKEEDFIDKLWLVNTHDTLLTFTSAGRVFWLPVHQLPDAGPHAPGRPIKIGRAHVCTPVTNAHLLLHLLVEIKNKQ